MLPPSTMRGLIMLLLTLLSFSPTAEASSLGFWNKAAPAQPSVTLQHVTKNMQDVLLEIQKLHEAPSCQKLASFNLLENCVSYDGNDPNVLLSTDHVLSDFQKIYAIRMTACTLEQEANAPMPETCRPLLDINRPVQEALLSKNDCVKSLFKQQDNYWTTFEHAQAKSLLLCRAMRVEKDKDEALHLHKVLVGSVSDVNDALRQQKSDLNELNNGFHDLHLKVAEAQKDLKNDIEVSREATKQQAEQQKKEFQTAAKQMSEILDLFTTVQESAQTFSDDVGEKGVALNTRMLQQWEGEMRKWVEGMEEAANRAELAALQTLEKSFNQIYEMTGSVEAANTAIMDISTKVGLVDTSLDAPLVKIDYIRQQHDTLSEKQLQQFKNIEELTNLTIEASEHLLEHTGEVRAVLSPLAALARGFMTKALTFLAWFLLTALIVFRAFYFLGGLPATGIAGFTGIVSASILMHYADPLQVSEQVINSHPNFLGSAPAYLSPLLMLLCGVCIGITGSRLKRQSADSDFTAHQESSDMFAAMEKTKTEASLMGLQATREWAEKQHRPTLPV